MDSWKPNASERHVLLRALGWLRLTANERPETSDINDVIAGISAMLDDEAIPPPPGDSQ